VPFLPPGDRVDELNVREGNRERCVSDFTLRWLSKKCNVAKEPHGTGDYLGPGHVGDEKAPVIEGRGKLAERIEVEFGPFRSAASRRAECVLVALPPVLGSWFNQRSGVPWS
jgi:hypothetical protein